MPTYDLELTIGSVALNQSLTAGSNFYILRNTPEILSTLSTRKTDLDKQGEHGTEDSLSYYGPRILPIEGEIWADTQANRITLEKALRKAVSLSVAQDFGGDDGYVLVQITDEDAIPKQIYAKVLEPPKFTLIESAMPEARGFSFVLYAKDPTIYAQSLSTATGPESYTTTGFTIQDADLPTFKDGALPSFQDDTGNDMSATNSGTFGTPPTMVISGPTTDPIITNSTTDRKMEFSAAGGVALLAGETLTIDVGARTVTKTDTGGTETDESGKLSTDSEWIYIVPGANVFSMFDDTPDSLLGQLALSWRNAWI